MDTGPASANSPNSPPLTSVSPSQCTATTRKGERCRAYAVEGTLLCRGHSMDSEGMRKLAEASAQARGERKQAKQDALERVRMGTQARLAALVDELEGDMVAAYRDALATGDPEALRRAQGAEMLLSRVYGRPTQSVQDVTPELPKALQDVHSMTPEERRSLYQVLSTPAQD